MKATFTPARPLFLIAALSGILAGAGCATPAGAADFDLDRVSWDGITPAAVAYDDEVQDKPRRKGRVIEGEVDINTFAPSHAVIEVDARTVDLNQVFEDLGPVAALWYQHVQTLSNPFFEGRAPESRGIELTKEYLEFFFRLYGLEPAFPAPGMMVDEMPGGEIDATANLVSYRQPFHFNYGGARIRAQVSGALCAINGQELRDREDYTVLGVSGSGHVTAPISFVGYGIEDGPDGYTSFEEDTDLTGRIALLLRYEPLDENGGSQWSRSRFSAHSSMAAKLRNLRERNAAGVILVNPPGARGGSSRLESIGRSSRFGPPMTVPAVQVTEEVAERILKQAAPDDGDLMAWRRKADLGQVRTVHLDGPHVTLAGELTRSGARAGVETENVGAILRGKGDLADQWIIIGGHLDHVGYGEFGTMGVGNRGKLHPGADDNASGTAGVLILARTLSEHYAKLPDDAQARSILFIGFSAEESGLHGSRHFVNNMSIPAEKTSIMINMDMIGRLRDDSIAIMGAGTAEGLRPILRKHVEQSGLTAHTTPGTSGRSDDANFVNAEIPAVHFFTGLHPEYHAPGDKAHTVNPAGASQILRLIHHFALELAQRSEQLTYTTPGRTRTADRGYGPVRLGIRPGMAEAQVSGVLVEEVSLETPAAEAGIISGDIIAKWQGEPVEDLRGLFENLQRHKPGDEVTLTILRGGEELEVTVNF